MLNINDNFHKFMIIIYSYRLASIVSRDVCYDTFSKIKIIELGESYINKIHTHIPKFLTFGNNNKIQYVTPQYVTLQYSTFFAALLRFFTLV